MTETTSLFGKYFEVIPALDAATRDAAHRIRHAVYCEDLGFEPIQPDGRERDQYDGHALHCLLRHLPSAQYVGVTRLVFVPRNAPDTLLPLERSCAAALYRGALDPARLPRHTVAEVSRLAVMREFRRRRGESTSPVPLSEADFAPDAAQAQPRFPFIPIGLYLGAIALGRELGIKTLLTLTEPRLAQHFSRFGVSVTQIGEGIEHNGLRVPSMIDVDSAIRDLGPLVRPIWQNVESSVRGAISRADTASTAALRAFLV